MIIEGERWKERNRENVSEGKTPKKNRWELCKGGKTKI